MRMVLSAVPLVLSLFSSQEAPEWKRLELELRPPLLKKYDITRWPLERPLGEITGPGTALLLERFAKKPEDLGLKGPVERALLGRLVWALFDAEVRSWREVDPKVLNPVGYRPPPVKPIQDRPTRILEAAGRLMKVLALTEDEIQALPDTYARTVKSGVYPAKFDPGKPDGPFLPVDLWDPEGPWLPLGNSKEFPLAVRHTRYFDGRSTFQIFLLVPEGRDAGKKVLGTMSRWAGQDPNAAPAIPPGTQVAIVEHLVIPTPEGKLVVSPLAETIEFRVIHQPEKRFGLSREPGVQSVFRFRLRPDLLRSSDPAPIRALTNEPPDWEPVDQLIEHARTAPGPGTVIGGFRVHCSSCHSFAQAQTLGIFELRWPDKAGTLEIVPPDKERQRILRWKETDETWKELQPLFR